MASPPRETRIHGSLLAAAEKRLLIRMASAMPAAVNSDHLTILGAVAMLGAGVCYATGTSWPPALVLAVVCLAVNWFGDSLDGTLARVRRHERPRYGFYVDHVLDAVGILFVVGGLFAGGFASILPAAGFLTAYYLLNIEIALATHALGTFRIPTGSSARQSCGCCSRRARCSCSTRRGARLPAIGSCCSTSA